MNPHGAYKLGRYPITLLQRLIETQKPFEAHEHQPQRSTRLAACAAMEQTGTLPLSATTGFLGFHEANEEHGIEIDSKTLRRYATSSSRQNPPGHSHRLLSVGDPGLLPPHLLWLIAQADNKDAGTLSFPASTQH